MGSFSLVKESPYLKGTGGVAVLFFVFVLVKIEKKKKKKEKKTAAYEIAEEA